MAEKTIAQLPQTDSTNNTDFWHVSQGGLDKKISTQDVAGLFSTAGAYNLSVKEESSNARTAYVSDRRSYIRFLFSGTSTYTLSDVATADWRIGDVVWLKAAGGSLTVSPAAGVVINEVESVPQGKQAILRYVSEDEWDFILFTDVGGGGGGGTVDSVVDGDGINVDSTDPANPVVSQNRFLDTVILTANRTLSDSDCGSLLATRVGTTDNITITVPDDLSEGFYCMWVLRGTGTLTVAGDGITVHPPQGGSLDFTQDSYGSLTVVGTSLGAGQVQVQGLCEADV